MLRDYQSKAVEELMAEHSCVWQLPTGGGKSLVIRELAERHRQQGRSVTVLTHRRSIFDQLEAHGMNVVMVQARAPLLPTDVIISDECHRAMSIGWQNKIMTAAPKWNYGFTATPWRLDGKGLGGIYQNLIRGPSMRELINQGYLAPYKYIAPIIPMGRIKTKGGDYDQQEAGNFFTNRRIMGDIYETWKHHGSPETIGFACTVSHAESLVEVFRENGVFADYIAGSRKRSDNEKILKAFKEGSLQVLWSVDMISEGFDVPNCEAVILARPTQSLSLYLQQVGRVMRPKADGSTALILDHANNVRRHGMPCHPHNWSLEGETSHERKMRMVKKTTKICYKCHAINYIEADGCICCGVEFGKTPVVVSTSKNVQMGEFNEIKTQETIPAWVAHYKKIGYSGLLRVAQSKGYKPGWAYYQKLNIKEKYGIDIA